MFKEYFTLLLLGHILGDFYLQTNKIADKKSESVCWVLLHSFFYWLTMIVITIPLISGQLILYGTMISVIHTIIDILKYYYTLKTKEKGPITPSQDRNIFLMDQLLHLITLAGAAYVFVLGENAFLAADFIRKLFIIIGTEPIIFLSWSTALLLIHKPANIVISKLLSIYRPDNKENKGNERKAGRFIGTLERIIILILISIQEYSAIGLVLTAKSIARYDKISKEKDFAEYYLMGTLLSAVIVIVVAWGM